MPVNVGVGLQRGDEGKGKAIDKLAENHEVVSRFGGGPNAGHTIVLPNQTELALHLIPSGVAHENTLNIIGNGTFIDPKKLTKEISDVKNKGVKISNENLLISSAAHMILPKHIAIDTKREATNAKQGTTKSGIAPVAADKYMRTGARMEIVKNDPDELFRLVLAGLRSERNRLSQLLRYQQKEDYQYADEYVSAAIELGNFVTDTVFRLNKMLYDNPTLMVLAEGAQAF